MDFWSCSEANASSFDSYFDLEWEGPVLDAQGKPTKEVKSK